MKDFELLKRTYPISELNRVCDGYAFILDNTTPEERIEWEIDINDLQLVIKKDERYIYEVAKEGILFKVKSLSFSNYAIIRKHIFGIDDE
jgi:hypothetical protein